MKALLAVISLAGLPLARAAAQAPDLADLWRVASGTLAKPAALATGPTGAFWDAAAFSIPTRLSAGVDVLQTPDVVSVSGVLAGLAYHVGGGVVVGIQAGRLEVDELTRTTSSPISELGEIPVYAQFLGLGLGARRGPFRVGALVRAHDTRFDVLDDGGLTIDLGVHIAPMPRLTVAAASRFASFDVDARHTTDYYAAVEYQARTATLWGSRALVLGRYGFAFRPGGVGFEHGFSIGLALEDRLEVDLGWTREQGFGTASWRPVLGVAFQAGSYRIAVARGSGLNDVGAAFRLGLTAQIQR